MSDAALMLPHTAPTGPPARLTPSLVGVNGSSAGTSITTTCASGALLLLWDTNSSLTMPALQNVANANTVDGVNFFSLETPQYAGVNDISCRLSWCFAPSASWEVPKKGTGRGIVAWFTDFDPTSPIILSASQTGLTTMIVPGLPGLTDPAFVAAFTRRYGASSSAFEETVPDENVETPIISRRVQNAANSEARMGDTDGLVLPFLGQTIVATGSTTSTVTAVAAIRGALVA